MDAFVAAARDDLCQESRDHFMPRNSADVLIETLENWGVQVVFGLPGDGINGIMEALRKRKERIRFIQTRHEEAAAFAVLMIETQSRSFPSGMPRP
jgi:glyoxylate carboligase